MKKKFIAFLGLLFALSITPILADQCEEANYHFAGTHYIASYKGCDAASINDVEGLRTMMLEAVNHSGATLLSSNEYVFPPSGFTMVCLLSESHASIHTYPEHHACFIDLFTCGTKCSYQKFEAIVKQFLKPNEIETHIINR